MQDSAEQEVKTAMHVTPVERRGSNGGGNHGVGPRSPWKVHEKLTHNLQYIRMEVDSRAISQSQC